MVSDKLEMADRTRQSEEPNKPEAARVFLGLAAFLHGGPRQKDALGGCCQLLRIFIQQEISQLQLQLLLKLTKALKNKQTAIEQFKGRGRGMKGQVRRCSRDAAESQLQRATLPKCCSLLGLAVAPSLKRCSAFSPCPCRAV